MTTFRDIGFLSPSMKGFTESLMKQYEYKSWFEFSERLMQFGFEMSSSLSIDTSSPRQISTASFFIRSLKTFQSVLILGRNGLTGDARALVRTIAEGAIILFALKAEPKFFERLVDAHYDDLRSSANATLNCGSAIVQEDLRKLAKACLDDVVAREKAAGRQFKRLNLAEVAQTVKDQDGDTLIDLYNIVVRSYSADGVHATISAITGHIEVKDGAVVGMKPGPEIGKLVETISTACWAFLLAAQSTDLVFATGFADRIAQLSKENNDLPYEEPNSQVEEVY